MKQYVVELQELHQEEYLDAIIFECMADDADHAEEQALNAYPNGEIINVLNLHVS